MRVAGTAGKTFSSLDPDTQTSARSFDAACLAAGAVMGGMEMIVRGEADNGFALVRPPGHHAETDRAIAPLFDGTNYGPQPIEQGETAAVGGVAPDWLVEKLAAGL